MFPNRIRTAAVTVFLVAATMVVALSAHAGDNPPGETPALGERLTQEQITSGDLTLLDIRREGRRVFSTPFNKLDGYGDGPMDPKDPTSPGGRPTLQNNGTYLRVNGLDGQTCLECHSILSNARIPARFGVGGIGGSASNAIFQPTDIDVDDEAGEGFASFNGRFINPPFLFGSGGVELLGKEMTYELQKLIEKAKENPGTDVPLVTKGVDFGSIRYENGELDTSQVVGIDDDLVVRPFGRKGEFPTVRAFDVGALAFHFGMQPIEDVGEDEDGDRDGVTNEVLVGEISAMHVFNTTLERPRRGEINDDVRAGFALFKQVGCTECHRPVMKTNREALPYCFPELPAEPFENVFLEADLSAEPTGFQERSNRPGLLVPLFADLKRHDMGDRLAETFGSPLDREFTTARLWGVADTAPYLHDGRATTLTEAIDFHGGDAESARNGFMALPPEDRATVIGFLRALRTPEEVGGDLDEKKG